ncbi:MAG: AbrB/MazE/SpoVT family DNA-binding domain-containing protein [Minisyncoccia bacterium]
MTTKIRKWGNSLAVRIPDEYIENLNWVEGSVVGFKQQGNKIIISSKSPKYTLDLMAKTIINGGRQKLSFPTDKSRGKEIW